VEKAVQSAKPKRVRHNSVNIRATDEEVEMARKIGNGNASHGYRLAVRWMAERSISGIPLSTMLRAAAQMAAQLEGDAVEGRPKKR